MPYLVTMFGGPNHPLYPKDPKARSAIDNVLNADQSTFYKAILEYAVSRYFLLLYLQRELTCGVVK